MRWQDLVASRATIGFTPQPQTAWLDPSRIGAIGLQVALAGAFASFDDKRELQQVLPSRGLKPPASEDDFWWDFAADTGDGFDATCTVANYLARPWSVSVGDERRELPPGRLLLLGGDEVYPTASSEAYEDRLKGPFQAAFPAVPGAAQPWLVALPGNHDWYDGLTSFLRQFTQQASIGRLRTVQDRSYFVLELARGWWLAGVDTQLGSYLDSPQLAFFDTHLSSRLSPGDAVIMSVPAPSWVHTNDRWDPEPDAFNTLHWFDRRYVRSRPGVPAAGQDPADVPRVPTHAAVRMWLTGDSHHYARYEELLPGEATGTDTPTPGTATETRRVQLVTCGLGGAYLDATHRLPDDLELPPRASSMSSKDPTPTTFARRSRYPSAEDSRRQARRIYHPWSSTWILRTNPRLSWVALLAQSLLVGLQLVVVVLIHGSSSGAARRTAFLEGTRETTLTDWRSLLILDIAVLAGVAAARYALHALRRRPTRMRWFWSVSIGVQVLVSLAAAFAAVWGVLGHVGPAHFGFGLLLAVCTAVVAALVGIGVFAVGVGMTNHKPVRDWQMAGQSIADHKGFLRMVIRSDGSLTIYPFQIDRVCSDWNIETIPIPTSDPGSGVDVVEVGRPVPAGTLPPPRLIEPPLTLVKPDSWTPTVDLQGD